MEYNGYYKQHELEFLTLFGYFKKKIDDGSILNDENAHMFIDVLQSMADSLNGIVELRRETDELDHNRRSHLKNPVGNCPSCMSHVPVSIVGETVNSFGFHVNMLECKHCRVTFEDYLPNCDEEMLCWYENFFNQMALAKENGLTAGHLDIPRDDLNSLQEVYEDLKRSRDSVRQSKAQLKKIEETSDAQIQEVTQYLYVIFGQMISGDDTRTELN